MQNPLVTRHEPPAPEPNVVVGVVGTAVGDGVGAGVRIVGAGVGTSVFWGAGTGAG